MVKLYISSLSEDIWPKTVKLENFLEKIYPKVPWDAVVLLILTNSLII